MDFTISGSGISVYNALKQKLVSTNMKFLSNYFTFLTFSAFWWKRTERAKTVVPSSNLPAKFFHRSANYMILFHWKLINDASILIEIF